ncbi:MAG: SPOR domain-containing protein [Muribaculaceae bacterium]
MNELILHIELLLMSRDCVVVPGLGAVLAHGLPARYDEVSYRFIAPSRSFTFNPEINHNDGALASSIARSKGITYEDALDYVATQVAALKHHLAADGELALGRVGSLHRHDGLLEFRPGDAAALLSPSTLWLPSLSVMPCEMRNVHTDVADDAPLMPISRAALLRKRVYRIAKTAAAIAVIVGIGIVMSTPLKVDNAQYAGIAYGESITSHSPEPEDVLLPVPGSQESELRIVLSRHDDAVTIVDTAAHNAYRRNVLARKHHAAAVADLGKGRYCLVIASCASHDEARRFIQRNNHLPLGILAKDGRYRVYAASADSYAEAQQAANAPVIAARYPDAWVCRR